MYISKVVLTALAASSTAQAFNIVEEAHSTAALTKRGVKDIFGWMTNFVNTITNKRNDGNTGGDTPNTEEGTCPAVWSEISTTLTAQFLKDGECTDAARAAIRAAFHDCFNNACDGSLILTDECSRNENKGLEPLCASLGKISTEKAVGAADLIQFAAAHAIKTCPGGPTVPVKMGRKDSKEAAPTGGLPPHDAPSGGLIQRFAAKGFTPTDLAALIGAHTTAKQRFIDPANAGTSLDSTPGQWDNKFYAETRDDNAPFVMQADKNVANDPATSGPFNTFAQSKGAWDAAFVSAMTKMSMLGVEAEGLVDCTSALPGGSRKREIRRSNLFDRLKW